MAKIKPVARPAEVTGRKWFAVDLFEQTLVAYEGERAVFATLIASGLAQWGTTEGVHQVWARHEQVRMSGAAGEEAFWNLPLVPWALFFTKSEQALHGAYWHDGFGYRRSRGCVNLSLTDAKWIFDWAAGDEDVWVFVYHSAEYRGGAPQ
jgi:lipoprotein-anchoring transpeptidase ErfK/SrfK